MQPENDSPTDSPNSNPAGAGKDLIAAKLRELAALGVDVSKLEAPEAPTVSALITSCLSLYPSRKSASTYKTHLDRLAKGFGPICDQLCEPCLNSAAGFKCACSCSGCQNSAISLAPQGALPAGPGTLNETHVKLLKLAARRIAIKHGVFDNRKRAARGQAPKPAEGLGAEKSAVHAIRSLCVSGAAYLDGANPGLSVKFPRQPDSSRRALADWELVELYDLTATSGNDPALDALLFDFGLETGARREGAHDFTVGRISRSEQILKLIDKFKMSQKVPVSLDLIDRLLDHAVTRGGPQCDPSSSSFRPDAPVFWYAVRGKDTFRPVTSRRFDGLHTRWQCGLSWGNDLGVTYHYLRHTISEMLKARYGDHYAKRYLRHADGDVTDLYGSCSIEMLARALSELFGYEHPLVAGRAQHRTEVMNRHFGHDGP